jgi:hypothetical protein
MSEDKLIHIQELIDSAMSALKTANSLLREVTGITDISREKHALKASILPSSGSETGKVIEGVFDGQNMVDSNGQTYPVPANYASKSKLVENDGMKLTITEDGKFMYKQILPIPRRSVVGVLIQEDGQYKVLTDGKTYRVLLASVTFYRAEVGDQVSILLPEGDANWGAIDAVIPKHLAEKAAQSTMQGISHIADGELTPNVE